MAFPEDAVQPMVDCMGLPLGLQTPILGPGPGLPNFALASFACMLGGINFILDFIPPDPGNLPSLPIPFNIFIDPFVLNLNVDGDLGTISLPCLPGAPDIPATGPSPKFNQGGMAKLTCMSIAAPYLIIEGIALGIINDLEVVLPTLQAIIDILVALALGLGLVGLAITNFIGCFAQGLFDMVTALIPV